MSVLINQKDCLDNRQNLGLPDCILEAGKPTGFIITPKRWSINLETDTLDLDYLNSQIQQGNFIPVLDAVDFTNNTPEPTTEETDDGIMSVVRNGKPYFSFKYWKGGWKYASALYSYNSLQAFDVLLVHKNGVISGATDGTVLSGFDLGMLNTNTYMFVTGSTQGSVTVSMQLIDENQFMMNVAMLDRSVLGFDPNRDLQPITDIKLTGTANATDNKIYVSAKFAMNEAVNLGGIESANLRLTVNGVQDVIVSTVYNSVTGLYEITPTATLLANDAVVVQLYDATATPEVATAVIFDKYYKG